MCGLVGLMGNISTKEEEIFENLLVIDALRGPHSTGVSTVDKDGDWKLAKQIGPPHELFGSNAYTKAKAGWHKVMLGHNRYSTVGKTKKRNAHPFEFDSLVGMHNGTLVNKRELVGHDDFDTDSEALFYNIDQFGVENVIPDVSGAYALVWYDKENYTLNFLRNDERTLFYAYSQDRTVLYFASEAGMIKFAVARHGKTHDKVYQVSADKLYTWQIPRNANEKLATPDQRPLAGKPRPQTTHNYTQNYHRGWGGQHNHHSHNYTVAGNKGPYYTAYDRKNGGWIIKNREKQGFVPLRLQSIYETNLKAEEAIVDYMKGVNKKTGDSVEDLFRNESAEFFPYFDSNKNNNVYRVGRKTQNRKIPDELKGAFNSRESAIAAIEEYERKMERVKAEETLGNSANLPATVTDPIPIGDGDEVVLQYGPDGEILSREEFDKLTKHGCDHCGDIPEYGMEDVWFFKDKTFFCQRCVDMYDDDGDRTNLNGHILH